MAKVRHLLYWKSQTAWMSLVQQLSQTEILLQNGTHMTRSYWWNRRPITAQQLFSLLLQLFTALTVHSLLFIRCSSAQMQARNVYYEIERLDLASKSTTSMHFVVILKGCICINRRNGRGLRFTRYLQAARMNILHIDDALKSVFLGFALRSMSVQRIGEFYLMKWFSTPYIPLSCTHVGHSPSLIRCSGRKLISYHCPPFLHPPFPILNFYGMSYQTRHNPQTFYIRAVYLHWVGKALKNLRLAPPVSVDVFYRNGFM